MPVLNRNKSKAGVPFVLAIVTAFLVSSMRYFAKYFDVICPSSILLFIAVIAFIVLYNKRKASNTPK